MGTIPTAVLIEHDWLAGRWKRHVTQAVLHVNEHVGQRSILVDDNRLARRWVGVLIGADLFLAHVEQYSLGCHPFEGHPTRYGSGRSRVDHGRHSLSARIPTRGRSVARFPAAATAEGQQSDESQPHISGIVLKVLQHVTSVTVKRMFPRRRGAGLAKRPGNPEPQ